jgi:hypothetical protein
MACPFEIPKFQWADASPEIVKCTLCDTRLEQGARPGCVEACPREAVIYGKVPDLLKDAHARIAANPKLYVDKVYGEHEAGGTQVLYLSAVPFEKLGLPVLDDRPAPQLSESVQHGIYRGFIAPAALYAALGVVLLRNRNKNGGGHE